MYVNNWAKCDTLCNHAVGSFIEMYPECVESLKGWARSENRWLRRASAVTLILPARKGMFLGDIFEIAEVLLKDEDDMVQKGYGWMLKEASKSHLQEVFEYVMAKKAGMPRTALRYAIEKMPEEMRRRAMER
jgi:3-methyladenine DNA glycosylase AlkD